MKKLGKALGAFAVAGAVAAGGAAFTNSNTQPADSVAGYGTTTVSGVTATSIVYGLNAVGDTIDTVNLVLTGDTTVLDISYAFNAANSVVCDDPGTYNGVGDETTYACTANQSVTAATNFHLIATNN
jgi:hypothetical protein